jgi:two-component system chemotaxis response regulator CheY
MCDKESKFSSMWTNGQFPAPETVVVTNIVEDLWETYVDEMNSFLPDLEKAAMSLETSDNHEKELSEVRRILHSVKGDSGMCGIADVHDLCHEMESALDHMHEKGYVTDVLLKAKDWIEAAIKHLSEKNIATEKDIEQEEIHNKPKARALVIDDDIVCRKRLKMLLQDYFDCTFACDGQEGAIEYVQSLNDQDPYKLITLDINMPKLNGHETLQAIRKTEEEHGIRGLDGIKVIMTTSESASDHVFSAFREGCEAYVVKTDMGDKLLDEIAKLGLLKVVKVEKAYALD